MRRVVQAVVPLTVVLVAVLVGTGCAGREPACDPNAPEVYRFAERTEQGRVERPWRSLDLKSPEGELQLSEGWGPVEAGDSGRWVVSRQAGVRFACPRVADLSLRALIRPYSRRHFGQTCTVTVNGKRVGRWHLERGDSAKAYQVLIPAAALVVGENRLTFRFRYVSRRKGVAACVSGLELSGLPPPGQVAECRPAGEESWRQEPGCTVAWRMVVPRGGWLSVHPVALRDARIDACKVWLRVDGRRHTVADFAEMPMAPATVSLAAYGGRRATLEFEVYGDSAVEWEACAVGGHIEPRDVNVYLLTIDTLRADRVGAYGYARDTTPTLDALAAAGSVFTEAFSCSNLSVPSHATILTGRYPQSHGICHNGLKMNAQQTPLAEILTKSGYETAAYVNWALLAWESTTGKGFTKRLSVPGTPQVLLGGQSRKDVYAAALNWIDYYWDRPQFLWVHSQYLHMKSTPEPYGSMFCAPNGTVPYAQGLSRHDLTRAMVGYSLGRLELDTAQLASISALYDGALRLTDDLLGDFLERLRLHGLDPYAAIVVTSDHGMAIGERRMLTHIGPPHDYQMRVPLIGVLPGSGQVAGRRMDPLVELTDVAPTILSYLGLSIPRRMQGRDLMPFIRGMSEGGREHVFSYQCGDKCDNSVRSREWLLVRGCDGDEALYRVSEGGGEQPSVIGDFPDVAAELRVHLNSWLKTTPNLVDDEAAMTDEVKDILRKAGYLDAENKDAGML